MADLSNDDLHTVALIADDPDWHAPDVVRAMAAELLRAREALAAADRLAEAAIGETGTHRLAMKYRAARRGGP